MNERDNMHPNVEGVLRRVRPHEPSAELKAKVLHAARDAWRQDSAGVPWQVPIRRLAISAAAAAVMVSFANLYGNGASAHHPAAAPVTGYAEPCDLDAMTDVYSPFIRAMAMAERQTQRDAAGLLNHLEMIREALRESEPSEASETPDAIEQRSRLPGLPLSLHS